MALEKQLKIEDRREISNACQKKKYPFPTIPSEESDIIAGVQSKLCSLHNLPFPFDVTKRLQGIEQKTLADILADPVEYQRYDKAEILCRGGTAVSLKGICAQSSVQLFLSSVLTLLSVILHSHTALNPITLLTAAAMFTYCSSRAIVGPCLLRSFPVFAVQSMVRNLLRARPDKVTFSSTAKIFHNLHDGLNP
ncbi:hypothetical protein SRHO_G00235800 [Serrasalmus rhombeus]